MKKPFGGTKRHLLSCGVLAALVFAASAAIQTTEATPQTPATAHKVAAHKTPAHAAASTLAPPVKTYGSKSAPITVEAYTDYQCPGCRQLFENALRPMINDYVVSGKVYLIHHDFPLVMHTYSGQAARWANAAAEVGDFGPVESALFDNQPSWQATGNIAPFVARAMPSNDFQKVQAILKGCTTPAPQYAPGIDPMAKSGTTCPVDPFIGQDIKSGGSVPVNGTPTYTIYLRGQKIATTSNIVSWPILKQFFDSLLNQ